MKLHYLKKKIFRVSQIWKILLIKIKRIQNEFVYKDFEIKNLGENHDLYVQSDALFLVDVLENFQDMCVEIYGNDPANFPLAPGLEWQAALKYTKVKLDF